MRIQETIRTIYRGIGGECYMGDDAWRYVHERTGVDLKGVVTTIAEENRLGR